MTLRCYGLPVATTLTIRLQDEVLDSLEAEARRTNRSKGHIVRQALQARLRARRGTALDALAKYVGIIDGPRDLSTNKRHLAGFGQQRRRR